VLRSVEQNLVDVSLPDWDWLTDPLFWLGIKTLCKRCPLFAETLPEQAHQGHHFLVARLAFA
jgi:hypothetical protein